MTDPITIERKTVAMAIAALEYHQDQTRPISRTKTAITELRAALEQQAKPVAWCALTASGQIAYFDGKPMVMAGPVGNEHHQTPLYAPTYGITGTRK